LLASRSAKQRRVTAEQGGGLLALLASIVFRAAERWLRTANEVASVKGWGWAALGGGARLLLSGMRTRRKNIV
jgi:hypothetical protein